MTRFCPVLTAVVLAGCSIIEAPGLPADDSSDLTGPTLFDEMGDTSITDSTDSLELDATSSEDVIHEWVGGCFSDYKSKMFTGCPGDRVGMDSYWPHDKYIFDLSCESLCCNYGFVGCIRGRPQKVVAFEIHPCVEAENTTLPDGFPCDQLWPKGSQFMCECTNDPNVTPAEFPGWQYTPATPVPAK